MDAYRLRITGFLDGVHVRTLGSGALKRNRGGTGRAVMPIVRYIPVGTNLYHAETRCRGELRIPKACPAFSREETLKL
jgi:hypothetical protein